MTGLRLVSALVGLLVVAGCTSDQGGTDPNAGPSGAPILQSSGPSTAGPSKPAVDRTDPMAVYAAWWKAVSAASAKADAAYPGLAELAVQPLLAQARAGIQALKQQGVVQIVTYRLSPKLTKQKDGSVQIADCVTAPAGTYKDAKTGQPRAPEGFRNDTPSRDSLRFVLRQYAGFWYLVAATNVGGGTC